MMCNSPLSFRVPEIGGGFVFFSFLCESIRISNPNELIEKNDKSINGSVTQDIIQSVLRFPDLLLSFPMTVSIFLHPKQCQWGLCHPFDRDNKYCSDSRIRLENILCKNNREKNHLYVYKLHTLSMTRAHSWRLSSENHYCTELKHSCLHHRPYTICLFPEGKWQRSIQSRLSEKESV